MKLDQKIALITGGSQGIGEAIAARFACEGARVAVVASTSVDKAQRVAKEINGRHGSASAFVADVTKPREVSALFDRVEQQLGPVDILVNSAGLFLQTVAGQSDVGIIDRMIDTNLKGTWHMINRSVPSMRARKTGWIINIASVAGLLGVSTYSVYSATKAGIIMMTRALGAELARDGIHVNCIAPGNTATPMNEDIRTKPEFAPMLQAMAARTPSGRTYSDPEDMAGAALFLASDESRAMYGSCMVLDEGFMAGI